MVWKRDLYVHFKVLDRSCSFLSPSEIQNRCQSVSIRNTCEYGIIVLPLSVDQSKKMETNAFIKMAQFYNNLIMKRSKLNYYYEGERTLFRTQGWCFFKLENSGLTISRFGNEILLYSGLLDLHSDSRTNNCIIHSYASLIRDGVFLSSRIRD
jgi:hypothetical protein